MTLEQENAELKERLHEVATDWQVNQMKLEELKAHINILREALENIVSTIYMPPVGFEYHGITTHFSTEVILNAKEALSKEQK